MLSLDFKNDVSGGQQFAVVSITRTVFANCARVLSYSAELGEKRGTRRLSNSMIWNVGKLSNSLGLEAEEQRENDLN